MAHRWKMKELETYSSKRILLILINERRGSLTNPYAPLAQRLIKLERWVERNVRAQD